MAASGCLGAALLLGAIRGDLPDQMGAALDPDARASLLAMSEATLDRRISVFRREDRGYAAAPRSRRARSAIVEETEVSPSWRERAVRPGFVQADAVVFRDDRAAAKYPLRARRGRPFLGFHLARGAGRPHRR